mmetsp:Transcript_20713/g.31754  ORF Transcript_20713/g.31754 Transcript_20713/m.31754 type:complete len:122 (-) Transcript_20713:7386-7751(-)
MPNERGGSDRNAPDSARRWNTKGKSQFGKKALSSFYSTGKMGNSKQPYITPGSIVGGGQAYNMKLKRSEYPETFLNSHDYAKRLRFKELMRTRLEAMCEWKQKDLKGLKKSAYIKEIQKKN